MPGIAWHNAIVVRGSSMSELKSQHETRWQSKVALDTTRDEEMTLYANNWIDVIVIVGFHLLIIRFCPARTWCIH